MKKSFWLWLAWFLLLFLLDFSVPFVLLNRIPTVKGSFLFWLIWIMIAIFSMFIMFWPWRDDETEGSITR